MAPNGQIIAQEILWNTHTPNFLMTVTCQSFSFSDCHLLARHIIRAILSSRVAKAEVNAGKPSEFLGANRNMEISSTLLQSQTCKATTLRLVGGGSSDTTRYTREIAEGGFLRKCRISGKVAKCRFSIRTTKKTLELDRPDILPVNGL